MFAFTEPQRRYIDMHRVARLATAGAGLRPHVVPICYARDGDNLCFAIDEKPKTTVLKLKRLRNIRENPQVALIIDDYSEDWSALGYLMVEGIAEIITEGPSQGRALALLRERYPQYRSMKLEDKPVVLITPRRAVCWGTAG